MPRTAAYESLRQRVEARRRATEGMIEELRKTITAKLEEAQVPVIQIDGRIKRLFSIHQKLKRQKIDLEQVYDLVALRIVTGSVRDCYAALGIIHQTWAPVPGRIKDFIAMPRPNGYQSLHTSVVSERASRSRCRSGPPRCTASRKKGLPRTGNTRKDGSAPIATSSISCGCASCSNGSRRCAIRRSSSRTSRSISIRRRSTSSRRKVK